MQLDSMRCIEEIPVKQLRPNPYNPNRMTEQQFIALKRAIRNDGFCGVLLVRRKGNVFLIVDGEHRWRAARDLKLESVPCLIGEFDENQARALTLKMNQIHGYWSAPELLSLLEALPDSIEDLGFSEHEWTCELERALGDQCTAKDIDAQWTGTLIADGRGERRRIGFVLSAPQRKLLERALNHAAQAHADESLSRSGALEIVLAEYLDG